MPEHAPADPCSSDRLSERVTGFPLGYNTARAVLLPGLQRFPASVQAARSVQITVYTNHGLYSLRGWRTEAAARSRSNPVTNPITYEDSCSASRSTYPVHRRRSHRCLRYQVLQRRILQRLLQGSSHTLHPNVQASCLLS